MSLRLGLLTLALFWGGCDAVSDVIDDLDPQPELNFVMTTSQAPSSDEPGFRGGYETVTTLVLTNTGAGDAQNVSVRITIPEVNTFNAPSVYEGEERYACAGQSFCRSGQAMTLTLPQLAAGEQHRADFLVSADGESPVTFQAAVDADGLSTLRESLTATTTQGAALRMAVAASPATVVGGETIDISAAFTNGSESPYTTGTLSITLPNGLSVVSTGSGTTSGQTVSWTLGALDVGESGRRELTARVAAGRDAGETLVVESRLQAGTNYDERAQYPISVVDVEPPLRVRASLDNDVFVDGRLTVLTFEVSNTSSRDAENVDVFVSLPAEIETFTTPTGVRCSGQSFCRARGFAQWEVGRLSAGQTRTVDVSLEPRRIYQNGSFFAPTAVYLAAVSDDEPASFAGYLFPTDSQPTL